MRNFDERMEEIRRRAEALRMRRRRRGSAVAWGAAAAACLCLALWSPVMRSGKEALPEFIISAGSGDQTESGQTRQGVTEIRALGMGGEKALRDPEKILAFLAIAELDAPSDSLQDRVQASGNDEPVTSESAGTRGEDDTEETLEDGPRGDPYSHSHSISADSQEVICTLLLIRENGEELRYLLTSTALIETESGAGYPLDRNRLQLLLELLETD